MTVVGSSIDAVQLLSQYNNALKCTPFPTYTYHNYFPYHFSMQMLLTARSASSMIVPSIAQLRK